MVYSIQQFQEIMFANPEIVIVSCGKVKLTGLSKISLKTSLPLIKSQQNS